MTTVIPKLQPHMIARWQEVARILEIASSYGRGFPLPAKSYPLPEGRLLLTFYGGMATIPELSAFRQAITADMTAWRERVLAARDPTLASATRAANTQAMLAKLQGNLLP